ncbi:MAG: GNAT family N-acetyltransferase [Rhodospirillales bacterium]|jgi:GNAT superfamily N-acetyltransferase|nr:GNAT family N-acetyltransferase [Rhodospirillales bacterium]HJO72130.1 GNAT family N-acetyltransferase [Rhodospirillales bacterium]
MTTETDPFKVAGLRLRELAPADAGRGAALSAKIGWNQVESDWRYMLANGAGFGCTAPDGKLVATAMALPYDGFAWVCVVLVAPDHRGRGVATDLMRRVLDDLQERGVMAGLDATPAGREVYKHLGFEDVYGLKRLWAQRVASPAADGGEETIATIAPMAAADIDQVAAYDAGRFGSGRRALLGHLRARAPDRAFVARAQGRVVGFVMARDGLVATQIGPVVAEDADTAIALARHAVGGIVSAAVIDACEHQKTFVEWFEGAGFEFQRPYVRMLLGRSQPIDRKDNIFAPAGPEFG